MKRPRPTDAQLSALIAELAAANLEVANGLSGLLSAQIVNDVARSSQDATVVVLGLRTYAAGIGHNAKLRSALVSEFCSALAGAETKTAPTSPTEAPN